MRRHPILALLYVWACDLAALSLTVYAVWHAPVYTVKDWVLFGIWTFLLSVTHLGGIEFAGLKVHSGWSLALEFAAALVLPFPLFCLTMLSVFTFMILRRVRQRHPEPFLGPDFNAANVIIDAWAAMLVYGYLSESLGAHAFARTVALLAAALVFLALQNILLATLLSLDMRKPWHKVGCLEPDTILSDGMMVTAGALAGRMFQFDPYLLALTLVPLFFMHRVLGRLNEAKLAFIDAKTELYNYRYFDETLAASFRKATQSGQPLALIFGDMDHLRDINNTHGHLIGDRALVAVARAFRSTAGADATACRFGGEEFVLLAPGMTKERAAALAERVRVAVNAEKVKLDDGNLLSVSVSIGVAVYPEDAQSIESLVKAADEAVYQAKNAGRNRVCVSQGRKIAAASMP